MPTLMPESLNCSALALIEQKARAAKMRADGMAGMTGGGPGHPAQQVAALVRTRPLMILILP